LLNLPFTGLQSYSQSSKQLLTAWTLKQHSDLTLKCSHSFPKDTKSMQGDLVEKSGEGSASGSTEKLWSVYLAKPGAKSGQLLVA